MAHDSEINQKEFLKHKKETDIMIHYQLESLKSDINDIKKDIKEIKKLVSTFLNSIIDQK